jgi:hypothetical protein
MPTFIDTFLLSLDRADLSMSQAKHYLDLEGDTVVPIDILHILKLRMLAPGVEITYSGPAKPRPGTYAMLSPDWRSSFDCLFGPNIVDFADAEKEGVGLQKVMLDKRHKWITERFDEVLLHTHDIIGPHLEVLVKEGREQD